MPRPSGEAARILRAGSTVYLPYVQEAFAAMKSPALDLGCGRGEWMELLAEAGIPTKGIDAEPGSGQRLP